MRASTYKKSEVSQERVLDAAILALAERGITQTSLQDIADAAGLSKGAIHYHFRSKDELLERALDRCCKRMEARVRAAFDLPGTPVDRVRRAAREMWMIRRDDAPEYRVIAELHVIARQNAAMRSAFGVAFLRARTQLLEDGFNRLLQLGVRPRVSLAIAPRVLLATLDGLALQQIVDPINPEDEPELLRALDATVMSLFEL